MLKQMDGVRFSRELLEPIIQTSHSIMEGDRIELNAKTLSNVSQIVATISS